MAMFPTHIKTSTALGIGYGVVTCLVGHVPPWTAAVATGLCSVAGMLPDIDSGPGIPLREITTFLAAVVPTMLISRFVSFHMNQEMMILIGAALYLLIRFGVAHFLRHYTVHRGMFHSFPAMAIFAELTYLLFYGESMATRIYMVVAVSIGFLSHLILDEIYSVDWKGEPRLKSSFGTACKFIGPVPWANASCYSKLAALSLFVLKDPSVVQQIYSGNGSQVAQTLEQDIAKGLGNTKGTKGGGTVVEELKQAAAKYFTNNGNNQTPYNPAVTPNVAGNNGQPYGQNPGGWQQGQYNGGAANYVPPGNYAPNNFPAGAGGAPANYYSGPSNNPAPGYQAGPSYAPTPQYQGQGIPPGYAPPGYGAGQNYGPQGNAPQNYVPQNNGQQYPAPQNTAPQNVPSYGGGTGYSAAAGPQNGAPAYQQAMPVSAGGAVPQAASNAWGSAPLQ